MDTKEATRIVNQTFKDVFGQENPFSLEDTRKIFAYDIPLPEKAKSDLGDGETWGMFKKGEKVMSQAGLIERSAKEEFMKKKQGIGSMDTLLSLWKDLDYNTGEKYLDSKEVAESDGIYSSSNIYRSYMQVGSQYIVYGYNNTNCKYLVAAKDNNACVSGIRFDQNGYSSYSYDVVWSAKVSRSMYIRNSFDLFECLFCSQLRSKKYCIANMQFEKEEYMKVKEMVIKWTLDQLRKKAGK